MEAEPARPDVDVVIATRNRPVQLRVAVAAVLAQDYPARVVVTVVFDQSEPDRTLECADDHRAVQVVENARQPGLAGARNAGVAHGRAALVAFCDDDDLWLPDKLSRQVEALEALPGAATCVTGITVAYDGRELDRVPTAETVSIANLVRNRGMEAHPSTVLVRREALEGPIGPVDEEIPGSYGEDFDWILRAAEAAPIAVVSRPLVRVVWGQSQFSTRWRTIVDAIDYLVLKHPRFSEDPRALARLNGRRSFALAALGERREALTAVKDTLRGNWRERRALLALVVLSRLRTAEQLLDWAHRRGHGI